MKKAESDVALARSARRGDPEALRVLTERMTCIPGLIRAMHARLGSPLSEEELRDVVQDTLTALWKKLDRFDGRSSLETWTYGFCGTQMIKFLERRRRRSRLSYGHEAELLEDDGDGAALARVEFEWVHEAVSRLEPPDDEVVRLKHFEELTFEEIGERLDLSPNTAKTKYYRALKRLRESLAPLWRAEQEEPR